MSEIRHRKPDYGVILLAAIAYSWLWRVSYFEGHLLLSQFELYTDAATDSRRFILGFAAAFLVALGVMVPVLFAFKVRTLLIPTGLTTIIFLDIYVLRPILLGIGLVESFFNVFSSPSSVLVLASLLGSPWLVYWLLDRQFNKSSKVDAQTARASS